MFPTISETAVTPQWSWWLLVDLSIQHEPQTVSVNPSRARKIITPTMIHRSPMLVPCDRMFHTPSCHDIYVCQMGICRALVRHDNDECRILLTLRQGEFMHDG